MAKQMKSFNHTALGFATRMKAKGVDLTSGFNDDDRDKIDGYRERRVRRKQFWKSVNWDKIKKKLDNHNI